MLPLLANRDKTQDEKKDQGVALVPHLVSLEENSPRGPIEFSEALRFKAR